MKAGFILGIRSRTVINRPAFPLLQRSGLPQMSMEGSSRFMNQLPRSGHWQEPLQSFAEGFAGKTVFADNSIRQSVLYWLILYCIRW
jgi:hypothetical protein